MSAEKVIDTIILISLLLSEGGYFYGLYYFFPDDIILICAIFFIGNLFFILLLRLLSKYVIYPLQSSFIKRIYYAYLSAKVATLLDEDLSKLVNQLYKPSNKGYNNEEFSLKLQEVIQILFAIIKSFDRIRSKGGKVSNRTLVLEERIREYIRVIKDCKDDILLEWLDPLKNIKNSIIEENKEDIYIMTNEDDINKERLIRSMESIIEGLQPLKENNCIQKITQDCFGTIEMMKIHFESKFKGKYTTHTLHINCLSSIDYTIIRSSKDNQNIRTLIIVSQSNMLCYEIDALNKQYKRYLDNGFDLLFWNYRGYGLSTGISTFSTAKHDILQLYDAAVELGHWNYFGAHGICIGGIPATYLSMKRKLDLLVCDQNFSSIDNLIKSWNVKCLSIVYKMICLEPSYIVDNYLNSQCKKILLLSPKDNFINEYFSLKTQVGIYFIRNNIRLTKPSNTNESFNSSHKDQLITFIQDSYSKTSNINDLLDIILSKHDQASLINTMVTLMNIIHQVSYHQDNIGKKANQKLIIPEPITKDIKDINTFYLIDDFFASLSYGNTNMYWLSLSKSYDNNRNRVGAFFSNLFVWRLNDSLIQKHHFLDEIERTLGDSLSFLKDLKEHLAKTESPMQLQVNHCFYIFTKIIKQWKRISVIPSKAQNGLSLDNIGLLIKLSGDHLEPLKDNEIKVFELHLKSFIEGLNIPIEGNKII